MVYSYEPFVVYQPNLQTGRCNGIVYKKSACDFSLFRGSAGPVEFEDGYLLLVHEVLQQSDFQRVYFHRFVYCDRDFRIKKVSKPFTFQHFGVEYCCGMTLDHTGSQLILSVGIEDREAYLYFYDLKMIQERLYELPDFLQAPSNWKGKIVILWSGLGEYCWAKRLEKTCNRLGWQCFVAMDPTEFSEYEKLVQDKPSTPEEIKNLIEQHQPDCVINLKWDHIYSKEVPHYISAFVPSPSLLAFNGILHTSPKDEDLKAFFEQQGKEYHSLHWHVSCGATKYQPVPPRTIFYCGFQWDNKRNGQEYRKMFALLDEQGCLDIYGPAHKWDCAPNSVRGMTFDEEELRLAMRKSGIVLVLHAQNNFDLGAPAPRIFEAAAASCIIISDRHPFVVEEFGDTVLYVDHTQPGEVLFQQIDHHRQWILSHPKEAEIMARKAHSIFATKFTLEKQLENFKNFHLSQLDSQLGGIKSKYELLCKTPSDINEHLPVLYNLAKTCSSVVEIGLRTMVSSWALLHGLAESSLPTRSYLGIDIASPPLESLALAKRLAGAKGISFEFIQADDRQVEIGPTEMLFIDSLHTYCHLTTELEKFSPHVSKYIALHDTSDPWGNQDEGGYSECPPGYDRAKRGLWPAVEDFLQRHPEWTLHERRFNNHGLTILKRSR